MKTHQKTVYPLDHGASLLFIDIPNARSAYLTVTIHSGYRHALAVDRALFPVPHLLEHMVFDGSKQYPSLQKLSRAIKHGGTYSNGSTDNYFNTYDFRFEPSLLKTVTATGFDMIYRPLLKKQSFQEECEVIVRETEEQMSDYGTVAFLHADQQVVPETIVLYHEQLEHIENVTLDQVKKYHKKHYTAANSQFILAGDKKLLNVPGLITQLNGELSTIKEGRRSSVKNLSVKKPIVPAVAVVTPPEIETITVALSFSIPGKSTTDVYQKLATFSDLIANDTDFSLFNKLRKTGDLYSLQFFPTQSKETIELSASFTTHRDRYLTVLAHFLYELRHYTQNGVSGDAFNETLLSINGTLLIGAETSHDYVTYYSPDFLFNETLESPEDIAANIMTFTQSDILTLAGSIIKNENLYISITGGSSEALVESTRLVRDAAFRTELNQPVTILDSTIKEIYSTLSEPRSPILGTFVRMLFVSMILASFLPALYDTSGQLQSLWSLGLKETLVLNMYIIISIIIAITSFFTPIRRTLHLIGYQSIMMFVLLLISYGFYVDVDKEFPNTTEMFFAMFGLVVAPILLMITAAKSMVTVLKRFINR